MKRAVAKLVLILLLVSSCSNSAELDVVNEGPDAAPIADGGATATSGGADSVAFLGDLVIAQGAPVIERFDPSGSRLLLDEGVEIVAAAGVFEVATDVTAQSYRVDYGADFESPPWGRLFVVSTAEDVVLATPVVIEIPRSAQGLQAVQMIDGEWSPVEITGDASSASIEIPHFSEVMTMVTEAFTEQQLAEIEIPNGDAPATFLTACLGMFANPLAQTYILGTFEPELARDLSLSLCTNALIRRSSPDGVYVSTGCVGDRIGGAVDFQQAIDSCAADAQDGAVATPVPTASGGEHVPAVPQEPAEPTGPVTYVGSASQGSTQNVGKDDLTTVDFTATIQGGMVSIEAAIDTHQWVRGGPSEDFPDQNCGFTLHEVVLFEGPTGNPTSLQSTVIISEVVDAHGALCDSDLGAAWAREVGGPSGRFEGQANGLGLQGVITSSFREIEVSGDS